MDGNNFHATVLQRPRSQHDRDDERDRQRHDTLRSGSPNQAPPSLPAPSSAHRHNESSFRLRSPSGGASDYQQHHYASPTSSHHRQSLHLQSPPRPALPSPVNHYMAPVKAHGSPPSGGPVAPTLPPPAGLAPPQSAGPSMGGASHHHHHPPSGPSPLHPPPAYFPPPPDHHARDSQSGASSKRRFYDPTVDSTTSSERRVSDSWQDTTSKHHQPRDTLYYPPSADRNTSYYEAPQQRTPYSGSSRPRSPTAHTQSASSAAPISPSHRPAHMASPNSRQAATPSSATPNGASTLAPLSKPNLTASPSKSSTTPSRAADPMSFSNILSSSEPAPKPRDRESSPTPVIRAQVNDIQPKLEPTPEPKAEPKLVPEPSPAPEQEPEPELETEPEPKVKSRPEKKEPETDNAKESSPAPAKKERPRKKPAPRKSAISAIEDLKESGSSKSRRSSSKKDSPTPRTSTKRQVNGQEKEKDKEKEKKTWAPEMERVIQTRERSIDKHVSELEANEADEEEYKQRAAKRLKLTVRSELERTHARREDFARQASRRLKAHAELGKRRYDEMYYEEALLEVREQELFAEKERKKDMQRKRRREKSMAVTMEQKEAALARADAAEDEAERQKHLRDAERANKKAQQTKLILAKGIKGPARTAELNLNLEGGTMSSFQASDVESTSKSKKSRSGNRPKKSKEQKQAEKDSAEAAQAALDAGEELPAVAPREETAKPVRIKIKKSKEPKEEKKSKDKDKDKTKDKEDKAKPDADADKENKEVASEVDEAAEKEKKFNTKGYNQIYDQIWRDMARRDVSKTFKLASDSYTTKSSNLKKTAILASKEAKRWQLRTNKGTKDLQARAKRVMRDMMSFWKRNEREERDLRKAAEKQELENARKEEADREAARQKRKLNFLISQTELYSHFIGKKIKTDEVERSTDHPDVAKEAHQITEPKLNVREPTGAPGSKVTDFENLDFDDEDETNLQAAAIANAQNAIAEAQKKAREFNNESLDMDEEGEMNFQNPTGLGDVEIEQPALLNAQLKEYQLKGLNWLVNLYEQGINGILADEMGLGKTVQSISVMAYLAEKHDIWGPFLVVAPASTLHNWQQEIAKFVPEFKILPYWGNAADRKILRKFWDRKHSTYRKDAAFHVCVTSYQLVVSDVAYFQKMRWQYMILDEAQAIKSSQSSRWKSLLGFHCRNRLLLTGTPIQNNMQELWALLHFIMPSLFDSHDEFSEWFSKDIESHAQSNTKLNEDQLKRLHMILKPFMLRRVKKHVQKELGDKIEEDVFCDLTYRQRAYYGNLRNQINIMDLVEKATVGDDQDSSTLMNLVMQFRKVCNHPDLFERAEVTSQFSFGYFGETASFVREGNDVPVPYSTRSLIDLELPNLVWTEDGRLDKASRDNSKAGWRSKALGHMMNIYSPEHVRQNADGTKGYSWLRFADVSPGDVYKATHESLFKRAADELQKPNRLGYMNVAYDDPEDKSFTPAHALFKIRDRQVREPLADITNEGVMRSLLNVARHEYHESGLGRLEQAGKPRASAPPIQVSCNSRSAVAAREDILFNVSMRKTLYGPSLWEEEALVRKRVPLELYPAVATLPKPDNEKRGFTNIAVPSMRRFVTDSGKLAKLDELLFKLKAGGHRVLLYFQMTRMIDMMEEYLTYRNYKYCRLDGSTKLEDRRDTVHDFQTRPEIFIFLLSTRAGGLGINLTSADTVIFYDSDWNPTIDSQAMDRAHRLGQTRQVTVYRLITKGTIEERIRKRALQKEEVQRVVIQGGGASVDFSGRRAPENRNRDIAMWLADDEQAELIEKREKELLQSGELEKQPKKKGGKRKKAEQPSLDEMYHEGEGNFDDGSKQPGMSGTATPAESDTKTKKAKGKGSNKKAKTTKQRLAMADGMVDM